LENIFFIGIKVMKKSLIIGIMLAVIAGGGVTWLGLWYFHFRTQTEQAEISDPCADCPSAKSGKCSSVGAENTVAAYYFYTTDRDEDSRKAEKLAYDALTSQFSAALRAGKLEWYALNSDLPENKHYLTNYGVPPRSLLIIEYKGSQALQWRNCDKIWNLVNNEESFKNYVIKEVNGYLGA
jgi:hypothetical protein